VAPQSQQGYTILGDGAFPCLRANATRSAAPRFDGSCCCCANGAHTRSNERRSYRRLYRVFIVVFIAFISRGMCVAAGGGHVAPMMHQSSPVPGEGNTLSLSSPKHTFGQVMIIETKRRCMFAKTGSGQITDEGRFRVFCVLLRRH
jgi:hypothetical protein